MGNRVIFREWSSWRGQFVLMYEYVLYEAHHSSPSPSDLPHYCPFTPVEPGYGVDLFEDDHLLLLPAADLRMDPASSCVRLPR
jgi:hypothetical protein